MDEKTKFDLLVETDRKLKTKKYVLADNNKFYNEELRVNSNGNVYIVRARKNGDNYSSKKISRLIAAKR